MKLLLLTASLGAAAGVDYKISPSLGAAAAAAGVDPCTPEPCARGTCAKARARYNLAAYLCTCPVGWSGVTCEIQSLVAPCFSSNMVLQSGSHKTSIYGHANATTAGDIVTVTVSPASAAAGSPFSATAGADGSWIVTLGELATSVEPMSVEVVSKAGAKQTLSNVLAGLVYVCSGQSNMALPVKSGYLPLTAAQVEAQAANSPHIRLLNNGHFWPPTPSHPGGTALGQQRGDAPGWQLPSYGNGSLSSAGTVANFSAACWFMGATISSFYKQKTPVGLISTDAGGTSIHRWVSQKAAAKCSQVTPTSAQSEGADIGTLFNPMVLPLARMAVTGFTWYQGEANECPGHEPVKAGGPCGGEYYACQLRAMIEDWRLTFSNSPADAPFLVNELGALQDVQWPVLRQAFHQAVGGVAKAAVVANADMGSCGGRVRDGLPSGAMHSPRKVNLGRRNGLAMLDLMGEPMAGFAPFGATGPVLQSASITRQQQQSSSSGRANSGVAGHTYQVAITFKAPTAQRLHWAGAADCTTCCATSNGSAIKLRIVNASDPSGYTWQRSEPPTVSGATVSATFTPEPSSAVVALDRLQFMFEGEPECALYNGVGGPDNATAIAASPFFVTLDVKGAPTLVPATPCANMWKNGSCWFAPEPCNGFNDNNGPNGTHVNGTCLLHADRCCWNPTANQGQCEDKGSAGCNP